MQKVAFIGSYDKADMILYIGKIMATMGYKVLIIDSTLLQKTKYIVPSISPTKTYMTEIILECSSGEIRKAIKQIEKS